MKPVILLIMLLCSYLWPSQDRKDFNRLKALVGTWVRTTATGPQYEEWVLGPEGNLLGREYRVSGGDTIVRERVNLSRRQQQVVYAVTSLQEGVPVTVPFFLTEARAGRYVFSNPGHDFPRRIVYEIRSADSLHAWIDGGETAADQRMDFRYRRLK